MRASGFSIDGNVSIIVIGLPHGDRPVSGFV